MLRAAAKVNLTLEVLGKRADGYHEIATVMQAVDLSDRITLDEADVLELRSSTPDVPSDGSNLALRAAMALRQAAGLEAGVRITLDKRIPVAAGLGGGSTDAAGVLLGLNRLWRLRWPLERLDEVAATLGSDVPFFLRGGTAVATGRGERVEPLQGRSLALVLVNPKLPASTAEMYGRLTPAMYSDGGRTRTLASSLRRGTFRVAASLYNGMEAAAAGVFPQIGQMRAALMAAGALGALMSGSGPTVFGVARSYEQARQIRGRVARGSWDCWAVRTLTGPAVRVVANGARRG
ncbi:MAG TPA: 4-(cytidine 5'-diphospho)-2-C-methyl-D-erythritol kinase [Methylomirabilota bacterium]|nr:4-(cytidine 5'-diphospho)-2-C-methyl-D-erythritol kinase [Methylomirabilota bacterium]